MISVRSDGQATDVREEPVTVVVTLHASARDGRTFLEVLDQSGYEKAHCVWTWDNGDALAPGVKHENMTAIADRLLDVVEKCNETMQDDGLAAVIESGRAAVAVNR